MALRRLLVGLLLILLAAACGARPKTLVPPPPAPPEAPLGGLTVSLTWDAPVDLDLYLTDPTSETVYFANNPSRTGARLLRDTRCNDVGGTSPFLERAHVPDPRPGRYRVGVDFIDACRAKHDPVSYRVVAQLGNAQRQTTGTVQLEQFQPIVLEFELRRAAPDGPVSLMQEGR